MKKINLLPCLVGIVAMVSGCGLQNECEKNEVRCIPGNGAEHAYVETCPDGIWKKSLDCDTNLCNADNTNCEAKNCIAGDKRCENDGIRICEANGKWGESDHSCEFGCFDDKSCKECDDNSQKKRCKGNSFQLCVSGKWSENVSCPEGIECAESGMSCNECEDKELRCVSPKSYQKCQKGTWREEIACPVDIPNCKGGGCTIDTNCADGELFCADGKMQKCLEGEWVEDVTCPMGCAENRLECAECTSDECFSSQFIRCDGGIKLPRLLCAGSDKQKSSCKSETACGDCLDGTIKCMQTPETSGTYAVYVCTNGEWPKQEIKKCSNGCNAEGTDCAPGKDIVECEENVAQCLNNTYYICNGGNWKIESMCSNGCDVDGVKCNEPPECEEKKKKCDNNILYECKDGMWNKSAVCPDGCDVYGIECYDPERCTDGTTRCVGNTSSKCQNGQWGGEEVCEHGCEDDIRCKPECHNGDTRCSNRILYVCKNESWDDGLPCLVGCDAFGANCRLSETANNCDSSNVGQICYTGERDYMEFKICNGTEYQYYRDVSAEDITYKACADYAMIQNTVHYFHEKYYAGCSFIECTYPLPECMLFKCPM